MEEHGQAVGRRVAPERVESPVIRTEAGIHREELDALQMQLLVAVAKFLFPAVLGRVHREEADQRLRVVCHVVRHIAVIDPQAAEFGFSAKDNRLHVFRGAAAVLGEAHGEVDLLAAPGAHGLSSEFLREVLRIPPGVAVDIDNHESRWMAAPRRDGLCFG